MPIEFEPDFRWDISTQTMKFYARHGRRRIRCAVTGPALEDRVRAHGLDAAGLERAFREHRQDIERKASDKIRTGRFQADGTILIRTVAAEALDQLIRLNWLPNPLVSGRTLSVASF
jgi:Protein of unknown function (DUF1488)